MPVYKFTFPVSVLMQKDMPQDAEMTLAFAMPSIKDEYGWFVDSASRIELVVVPEEDVEAEMRKHGIGTANDEDDDC